MISAVIAVYNGEKYIREQLRSVLFQSVKPDEVLIFDDCSTDKSTEIIEKFISDNNCNGWRLIKNSKNKGYCKNFLEGMLETKGEYIFLADQDDVWHADKVKEMTDVMKDNPKINALCCACEIINKDGEKILNSHDIGQVFSGDNGTVDVFKPESFVGRSFIRGCSVCFRREILQYIVPIELKGLLSHDWLITFTAALCGDCAVLNKVLMSYRCHGENTSFGQQKCSKEALQNRIAALEYSIEGHKYILSIADCFINCTVNLKRKIQSQIEFEQKRVNYLKCGKLSQLFALMFSVCRYRCYHNGFLKGIKVFIGDFSYRNF